MGRIQQSWDDDYFQFENDLESMESYLEHFDADSKNELDEFFQKLRAVDDPFPILLDNQNLDAQAENDRVNIISVNFNFFV